MRILKLTRVGHNDRFAESAGPTFVAAVIDWRGKNPSAERSQIVGTRNREVRKDRHTCPITNQRKYPRPGRIDRIVHCAGKPRRRTMTVKCPLHAVIVAMIPPVGTSEDEQSLGGSVFQKGTRRSQCEGSGVRSSSSPPDR